MSHALKVLPALLPSACSGAGLAEPLPLGASARPLPLLGYNSNALTSPAWDPVFQAAVADLKPAVLRYPGGTLGDHWDWQAGTIMPDGLPEDLRAQRLLRIPAGMEVWVTEYNVVPFNRDPAAGSWLHGLAALHLTLLMMQDDRVTMLLLHQLTGNAQFASLTVAPGAASVHTAPLTGVEYATRLLGHAAAGSGRAEPFTEVGVTGWRFDSGKVLLINPTAQAVTVNLPGMTVEVLSSPDPLAGQTEPGGQSGDVRVERVDGARLVLPPLSAALVRPN